MKKMLLATSPVLNTTTNDCRTHNEITVEAMKARHDELKAKVREFCGQSKTYINLAVKHQYDFTFAIETEFMSKSMGDYPREDFFDGMMILCDGETFEVAEYQAGDNENELHIFKDTPYLKAALKEFMKGNKRPKDAIKIHK